ncbi:hypothetical protein ACIQMZ_35570 [Streptomyces longwoodensis]|uniref:hypothetical protein n=1 Tax=Streptomyces longwoodensis TaxID=68231 RepID=UPI0037FC6E11
MVDTLSVQVTDVQWDFHDTPFMDVAGLHLLFAPSGSQRKTTVTGLHLQPLRLLLLAADLDPAVFDVSRLLPDTPPPWPDPQPANEKRYTGPGGLGR